MKKYNDTDDYLLISGIQHFMFCKHQWALIHIEDIWQDNALTYEGVLLHERVHNPEFIEKRNDIYTSRSVAVVSHKYKIQGIIDLIEYRKNRNGIYLKSKDDYYTPIIIEYKRGSPKEGLEDEAQLVALAIALEEMLDYKLDFGYIYYFQTKKRHRVEFTSDLRNIVTLLIEEMNNLMFDKKTPNAVKNKKCKSCSFYDFCSINFSNKNAEKYLKNILREMECENY